MWEIKMTCKVLTSRKSRAFLNLKIFASTLTIVVLMSTIVSASTGPADMSTKHMVFAHYMVCFATYGESLEGYKHDIQDAQAAGIDGFALNEGAWDNEPRYVSRTKLLFQAAAELNTGFKFIFSLDLATLQPKYIPEILRAYLNDPCYYRYQGRPVVSTFSGQTGVDWNAIIYPLRAEGFNICFIPFFYPNPVTELPSLTAVRTHFSMWNNIADGYFLFGAAGTDRDLTDCNASYITAAREDKKLVMASFTPFYWGEAQPGRRFYETHGGFGVERQWMSIIANQPDLVEIVTWNDFNESYITPVDNPAQYESFIKYPARHPHIGYLELSKYFISWYKTGKQPKIEHDTLVYIYRVHQKNAVASTTLPTDAPADFNSKPVTDQRGDVQDDIYVTTLLKQPAQLRIFTGGVEASFQAPAGYHTFSTPFQVGLQHFSLYRKNKLIAEVEGEQITAVPTEYNFFPTTGVAFGR